MFAFFNWTRTGEENIWTSGGSDTQIGQITASYGLLRDKIRRVQVSTVSVYYRNNGVLAHYGCAAAPRYITIHRDEISNNILSLVIAQSEASVHIKRF